MKPKYEMTIQSGDLKWNEPIGDSYLYGKHIRKPKTDLEAVNVATVTVLEFNKSLKPHESRRDLISVQRVEYIKIYPYDESQTPN